MCSRPVSSPLPTSFEPCECSNFEPPYFNIPKPILPLKQHNYKTKYLIQLNIPTLYKYSNFRGSYSNS